MIRVESHGTKLFENLSITRYIGIFFNIWIHSFFSTYTLWCFFKRIIITLLNNSFKLWELKIYTVFSWLELENKTYYTFKAKSVVVEVYEVNPIKKTLPRSGKPNIQLSLSLFVGVLEIWK